MRGKKNRLPNTEQVTYEYWMKCCYCDAYWIGKNPYTQCPECGCDNINTGIYEVPYRIQK